MSSYSHYYHNDSAQTEARKQRSKDARLYLMDYEIQPGKSSCTFNVSGTTGNLYDIILTPEWCNCTCPDYVRRNKYCKHIYFILLRVLKGENEDLKNALKNTEVYLKKKEDIKPRETSEDDECCICYDLLSEGSLDFCVNCRNSVHKDCIRIWKKKSSLCPLCRDNFLIKKNKISFS